MILKLAFQNIKGAGLRTWINVMTLSFIYVLIIWHQGIFTGMQEQVTLAKVSDEIGAGQYWQKSYDPYDSLTYEESHSVIPPELGKEIDDGNAVPVLVVPAAVYPSGRITSVTLKGIKSDQKVLQIDMSPLIDNAEIYPVMLGRRMAKSLGLGEGDTVTVRWRDAGGTFDAVDAEVVGVFDTLVPAMDNGQLWMPIEKLREMTSLGEEATFVTMAKGSELRNAEAGDFVFKDLGFLLKDSNEMVLSKRVGSSILYAILIFLAMLAIFDTQVLSIFRRRKEIGTLIALGMTRGGVIMLFTLEGALHGLLAIAAAAVYGVPFIMRFAKTGMPLPKSTDGYGFALGDHIYPIYTSGLVLLTIAIVMLIVVVVSYLPTRKIAKIDPTEALRGKVT